MTDKIETEVEPVNETAKNNLFNLHIAVNRMVKTSTKDLSESEQYVIKHALELCRSQLTTKIKELETNPDLMDMM